MRTNHSIVKASRPSYRVSAVDAQNAEAGLLRRVEDLNKQIARLKEERKHRFHAPLLTNNLKTPDHGILVRALQLPKETPPTSVSPWTYVVLSGIIATAVLGIPFALVVTSAMSMILLLSGQQPPRLPEAVDPVGPETERTTLVNALKNQLDTLQSELRESGRQRSSNVGITRADLYPPLLLTLLTGCCARTPSLTFSSGCRIHCPVPH